MIDSKIIEKLRKKYPIHPLIFHRSVEHSNNELELFEILESMPEFPMAWNEKERKWETCTLLK